MNPRRKPKFLRQGTYLKKVKKVWRMPRGTHTKLKIKEKSKGSMPNVGYGAPRELRGLHPSGLKEVMIYNLKDLEKVNKEKDAGRLSSTIGQRKRKDILDRAKQLQIRILNP
jgi:large subunit ribosomal protein L32e